MELSVRKIVFSTQWSWFAFMLYMLLGGKDSVIRLLRGVAFMSAAAFAGIYLQRHWGIGLWLGSLSCYLVFCAAAWAVLLGRLLTFFPFPVCRKGKCRGLDDYHWCHGTFFGKHSWGLYYYRCRCGDAYLRRGRRFMEFAPADTGRPGWINIRRGDTRPYKRLVAFRTWADDTD